MFGSFRAPRAVEGAIVKDCINEGSSRTSSGDIVEDTEAFLEGSRLILV